LFGSFARGDDDAMSDIDVLVVRPSAIGQEDPAWSESIVRWEAHARRVSGNPVNRIEVEEGEVAKLVQSGRSLWRAIRREGMTLVGRSVRELGAAEHA
jgi:predicted nucleotidyltransferase